MKKLTLIFILVISITSISFAQNQVRDTHPGASISAIDYRTGNLQEVSDNQAILFKDAFISLVLGTRTARVILLQNPDGRRRAVITQSDPQTNGNAFQLEMENTISRRTTVLFTFIYSVDQNKLYYYDPNAQNYAEEFVEGENLNNLNDCLAFGKFNIQNADEVSNNDDANYTEPVDVDVTATVAPPALPEYEQPECPAEGYLWQPGYWAFSRDNSDYYWVPGVWVAPPTHGVLWTPPYWGYERGAYIFHTGYWGASIGFYGGIHYGYGYQGSGFVGGEWHGDRFRYNTAVVRVNVVNVHNTYINKTVINNVTIINRNSFNGGNGVNARPSKNEIIAMREKHVRPTPEQIKNQWAARNNRGQFAKVNGGTKPADLALVKAPVKVAPPNTGVKPVRNPMDNKHAPNGQAGNVPAGQPGSKGVKPGILGHTTVKPITPGNPDGKPLPGGNVAPKPGEPAAVGVKPATPPNAPQKPVAPGANPVGQPNANPKPVTPGANPANPGANPANPPRVNPRPAAPGANPVGQPNANPKPVAPGANPANPGANPANPQRVNPRPAAPGANPVGPPNANPKPAVPGAKPVAPGANPANPPRVNPRPAAPGANPVGPPNANPKPAVPGAKPVVPVNKNAKPGAPGRPQKPDTSKRVKHN